MKLLRRRSGWKTAEANLHRHPCPTPRPRLREQDRRNLRDGNHDSHCAAAGSQSETQSMRTLACPLAAAPVPCRPLYPTPWCFYSFLLPPLSTSCSLSGFSVSSLVPYHTFRRLWDGALLVKGKQNYISESWLGFILLNCFNCPAVTAPVVCYSSLIWFRFLIFKYLGHSLLSPILSQHQKNNFFEVKYLRG